MLLESQSKLLRCDLNFYSAKKPFCAAQLTAYYGCVHYTYFTSSFNKVTALTAAHYEILRFCGEMLHSTDEPLPERHLTLKLHLRSQDRCLDVG